MSNSLRDQLLGLGYKPVPKPERRPESAEPRKPDGKGARPDGNRPVAPKSGRPGARIDSPNPGRPPQGRPARTDTRTAKPRSQEEIDLGKAYALRAQKEKNDRIESERLKQEEARQRREAKAKLSVLLRDKSLNDPAAEIARHFDYGGRIKRIHVTQAQLTQLNAGALGVVQVDGRYLLVRADLLLEAEAIFAPAVALKVDPDAPASEEPYSDPAYQVPDDLVW